jgi:hypothetical protein
MSFILRCSFFLGGIMKKISIVCLILGAILLLGGIGVRLAVDNNENAKELNEVATFFAGEGITPSLVSKLMNGEVKVFGQSVTLDDLLEMSDNEDVAELVTVLKLYAVSPIITICGAVILLLGVVLLITSKFRK